MNLSNQKNGWVFFSVLLMASFAHGKAVNARAASAVAVAQVAAPVAASVAPVVTAPMVPTASTVLSYKEWKNGKISASQQRLRQLQNQYQEQRSFNPRSPRLPLIQQDLAQEQWNLEVAQDLSARDYLYLYVKDQETRQRLPEIAARLSPEEVSLMLESYFQLIDRSQQNQQSPAKRTRLGTQTQ